MFVLGPARSLRAAVSPWQHTIDPSLTADAMQADHAGMVSKLPGYRGRGLEDPPRTPSTIEFGNGGVQHRC